MSLRATKVTVEVAVDGRIWQAVFIPPWLAEDDPSRVSGLTDVRITSPDGKESRFAMEGRPLELDAIAANLVSHCHDGVRLPYRDDLRDLVVKPAGAEPVRRPRPAHARHKATA